MISGRISCSKVKFKRLTVHFQECFEQHLTPALMNSLWNTSTDITIVRSTSDKLKNNNNFCTWKDYNSRSDRKALGVCFYILSDCVPLSVLQTWTLTSFIFRFLHKSIPLYTLNNYNQDRVSYMRVQAKSLPFLNQNEAHTPPCPVSKILPVWRQNNLS